MLKLSALSLLLLLTIEVSWCLGPPVQGMHSSWPGHFPTIPEEDERADNETKVEENNFLDDVLHIQDLDKSTIGDTIEDVLKRYRVHTHALPWFGALTRCWREGGQLAIPEDEIDARQLGRLLRAAIDTGKITNTLMTDAMHIGIHNINKDSSWKTVGGNDFKFTSWLKNAKPFFNGRSMGSGAILENGYSVYQSLGEKLIYACDMHPKTDADIQESIFDEGEYRRLAGSKLYHLHLSPLPWLDALAKCANESASLAKPANGREAGLLAGLLSYRRDITAEVRRGGMFIGLTDIEEENNWKDLEGNYVFVDNWADGRPNGSRVANCAAMPFNGAYIDVPCGKPRAFLCEKKNLMETPMYVKLEGFGRYAFHTVPRTWMEAVMKCRAENATLAAPGSKEEAAAMTKLRDAQLGKGDLPLDGAAMHVGVHDLDEDKRWTTTEGKRVLKSGFNNWTENSQNFFQATCAALKNEKFENRPCSTEAMFICKKAEQ